MSEKSASTSVSQFDPLLLINKYVLCIYSVNKYVLCIYSSLL